ncbi:MAG: TonB-dependent receptor [Acidobacteriaceae bacterium]|jgi:hypothetical protein
MRVKIETELILAICLGFISFFYVSPLSAQTATSGALIVTVYDPTGALIPGATVTVTNAAALTRTEVTNSSGACTFALLPVDDYRVSISAKGFKTVEVPSVSVTVAETATLNQHLQVGNQTQTVEVTTATQALQTQSSTLGTTVTSNSINSLPLPTRNFTQILSLSPGATADVFNATTVGRGSEDSTVNGAGQISNDVQLDGVSVWSLPNGQANNVEGFYGDIPVPSPDAVQEFIVQTTGYDAGYGRHSGASVNLVTKDGTNEFHGTLFESVRNNDLDANGFFQNSVGQPRGALKQNQFGGTAGRSILRDKLFLFLSYQGTRQVNGVAAQGFQTPSLPEQLTNDRTAATLGAEFCAANNPPGSPGARYATTFGGGEQVACDGSNINPVALALLNAKVNGKNLIPTPQTILNAGTASAVGSASLSVPATFNSDQGIGNLSYAITSRQTFEGKFFYDDGNFLRSFNTSPCVLGCGATNATGNLLIIARLTSVLTNNLVNEGHFASYYQRASLASLDPESTTDLGIQGIAANGANGTPWYTIGPVITVTGLFVQGGSAVDGVKAPQHNFDYEDQLSWTHGRMNVRAGFEVARLRWDEHYFAANRGSLTFQTFADFLLGESAAQNGSIYSNVYSSSGSETAVGGTYNKYRANDDNAYLQDDIRVNHALTLNLGLRWEYDGDVYDALGELGTPWYSLMNLAPMPPITGTLLGFTMPSNYPGVLPAGVYRRPYGGPSQVNPKDDFGPRAGLAWQPIKGGHLVVRAGGGVFYDQKQGDPAGHDVTNDPPLTAPQGFTGIANTAATFQVPWTANRNLALGFLNSERTPTSALTEGGQDQFLTVPMTGSWNLNVQYEFKKTWVSQVAFVGARAIHLSGTRYLNMPQLATATTPLNCGLPIIPAIASTQNSQGCIVTNTAANATYRVPIVGYAAGGFQDFGSFGDMKYDALEASIKKNMSHGLQLQASYTYDRTDTDGAGVDLHASGFSFNSNDPTNLRQEWGRSDYDRPQRLSVAYVYYLPGYGKGAEGAALSGWNISGITTAQSGEPMTLTDPKLGAAYGSAATARAELCPGMTVANIINPGRIRSKLSNYFNTSSVADTAVTGTATGQLTCPEPVVGAFASPGAGLPASPGASGYGNLGRADLLGPGQFNWDFATTKITPLARLQEGGSLEFRAEFFNIFNHPQFSQPGLAVNSGSFGVISSTTVAARVIQFGLKYAF